jgi:hypothetical protein
MAGFSVRVVNDEGESVDDVGVMVDFGLLAGGTVEGRTDSDGWVTFESWLDSPGTIWVHGTNMGNHSCSSGKTYSFTI